MAKLNSYENLDKDGKSPGFIRRHYAHMLTGAVMLGGIAALIVFTGGFAALPVLTAGLIVGGAALLGVVWGVFKGRSLDRRAAELRQWNEQAEKHGFNKMQKDAREILQRHRTPPEPAPESISEPTEPAVKNKKNVFSLFRRAIKSEGKSGGEQDQHPRPK